MPHCPTTPVPTSPSIAETVLAALADLLDGENRTLTVAAVSGVLASGTPAEKLDAARLIVLLDTLNLEKTRIALGLKEEGETELLALLFPHQEDGPDDGQTDERLDALAGRIRERLTRLEAQATGPTA
jgi:hypothetical protein